MLTTEEPIGRTSEPEMMQSAREGPGLVYKLPLEPGLYDVRLSFAEIGGKVAGERIFDVRAEGNPILVGLDIAAQVGQYNGFAHVERVAVLDGELL